MRRSPILLVLSCILALAAALTGPLLAPTRAGAGLPGLVVEDANDNGIHDVEVDRDVTALVLEEGSFATRHSILVARALTSRHPFGISLVAGQNLRVNADLSALVRGAGLSLVAQAGAVMLGERVNVMASGYIDVNAAAGIDVAAHASLQSRDIGGGLFLITDGNIAGGDSSRFTAKGGVDIFALSGEVHIGPGQMISSGDYVLITGGGRVWVAGASGWRAAACRRPPSVSSRSPTSSPSAATG